MIGTNITSTSIKFLKNNWFPDLLNVFLYEVVAISTLIIIVSKVIFKDNNPTY